jgi:hypothetical protein
MAFMTLGDRYEEVPRNCLLRRFHPFAAAFETIPSSVTLLINTSESAKCTRGEYGTYCGKVELFASIKFIKCLSVFIMYLKAK